MGNYKLKLLLLLLLALLIPQMVYASTALQPAMLAIWQRPDWWRGGATIDLDFANNRYYVNTTSGATTNSGGSTYSSTATMISALGGTVSHAPFTPPALSTPYYLTSTSLQSFNSRASSATYFNSSGVLQTATSGVARNATYSYNGSSWVANTGTLIEPSVVNTIHANDGTGAVSSTAVTPVTITSATASGTTITFKTGSSNTLAVGNIIYMTGCSSSPYNGYFVVSSRIIFNGTATYTYVTQGTPASSATGCSYTAFTAGTLPTNWSMANPTGVGVVAYAGTGSSYESGVYYEDVQIVGTPTASGTITIYLDTTPSTSAASTGQTWTLSSYLELSAGALTNVTSLNLDLLGYTGSTLTCDAGSTNFTPTSAGLSTQRYSNTQTFTTSSPNCTGMTREKPAINIVLNGSPVNFTLRIGMPQSEQSPAATSVIQDSGSATTRSADLVDVGTYFDSTGTLQNAVSNAMRLDYRPISTYNTAALISMGFLNEPAATNGVRNNLMIGASTSPSTLPTNWSYSAGGTGITATVVNTGTENGIVYVDIQFAGTATATGTATLYFETPTGSPVTYTNPYSASFYFKLQAGSDQWNSNCLLACTYAGMQGYNSSGTATSDNYYTLQFPSNYSLSGAQTLSYTRATSYNVTTPSTQPFTSSSTVYAAPYLSLGIVSGNTVNATYRIGMPQIESTEYPTSVIPTSGLATTRSIDLVTIPTGTWYSSGTVTLLTEATVAGFDSTNTSRSAQFDDGTNANSWIFTLAYAGGLISKEAITTSNTVTVNHTFSPATANTSYKMIGSYSTSGSTYAGALNAGSEFTATPSIPTNFTDMYIGSGRTTNNLMGWVQRLTYWPTQQSNGSLIDLTQ